MGLGALEELICVLLVIYVLTKEEISSMLHQNVYSATDFSIAFISLLASIEEVLLHVLRVDIFKSGASFDLTWLLSDECISSLVMRG